MTKMNVWKRMFPAKTHEGAVAQRVDPRRELRRTVLTCLLWEHTSTRKGNAMRSASRNSWRATSPRMWLRSLAKLATKMQVRHVPLFLVRETCAAAKAQGVS